MADLLKKAKANIKSQPKEEAPSSRKPSRVRKKGFSGEKVPKKRQEDPAEKKMRFSNLVSEKSQKAPVEKAQGSTLSIKDSLSAEGGVIKAYSGYVESAKRIFNTYKDNSTIDMEEAKNTASEITDSVLLDTSLFLRLFHERDSLEFYIYYNAVNVSILSVAIGIFYNYNKLELLDLAMVGLLHDIDLIQRKHIIDEARKLTDSELKETRKHPLNAVTLVDKTFNSSEKIATAILQHHERKDGQGYPTGLKDIQDLAKIIGIADTYEAIIHTRPYKGKIHPYVAIQKMLKSGRDLFPNKLIKALISCVGLYPSGIIIELNTGERCKVLINNPSSPARPVISVLADKGREKLEKPKILDLQKFQSLYIKKVIEDPDS
jgi:HD-GYP domain-containing protein (c-di-GMP phosphodiesterase class II)